MSDAAVDCRGGSEGTSRSSARRTPATPPPGTAVDVRERRRGRQHTAARTRTPGRPGARTRAPRPSGSSTRGRRPSGRPVGLTVLVGRGRAQRRQRARTPLLDHPVLGPGHRRVRRPRFSRGERLPDRPPGASTRPPSSPSRPPPGLRAPSRRSRAARTATYSAVGVSEWAVWGTGGVVDPDPEDPFEPDRPHAGARPHAGGCAARAARRLSTPLYADGRVMRVPVDVGGRPGRRTSPSPARFESHRHVARPGGARPRARCTSGTAHPAPVVARSTTSAVVTARGSPPRCCRRTVTAEYEDGSRDSRIPGLPGTTSPRATTRGPAACSSSGVRSRGTVCRPRPSVFVLEPDHRRGTSPAVGHPDRRTRRRRPSGWFVRARSRSPSEASDNRDPDPRVEVVGRRRRAPPRTPVPFTLDGDGDAHRARARATDTAGNVGEAERGTARWTPPHQ